jgi:hypothetical protein
MTTHTSRRAILAGAAAVPIAAAVASSPALAEAGDADLIRLGVKLEHLEREWLASTVAEFKEDEVREAACERAGVPWRPITSMPRDEHDEYRRKRAEATRHLPPMTDNGDYNDDLNDRMFALIDEIQTHKAATLAGLAVLTRACVLSNASQWGGRLATEDERDRRFIEALCDFLGITPVSDLALAAGEGGDGRAA